MIYPLKTLYNHQQQGGVSVQTNQLHLSPIHETDFSISYSELDSTSVTNQNEPHIHKECEIYLNLTGDVSFEVENHLYPIRPGSVVITRPYEFHHCIYRSNALHRHYWITFSAPEGVHPFEPFFNREKGSDNLIQLTAPQLARMRQILDSLLYHGGDNLKNRIAFLQMLQLLSEATHQHSTQQLPGLPKDVMLALQYMDEHLTDELDIRTLSKAAYVSVNTLERHFRQTLQDTPFHILRKKRLFAATRLLRIGCSVYDAASKSGFPDYSHFIVLFRKHFGMTPSQYRKLFLSIK